MNITIADLFYVFGMVFFFLASLTLLGADMSIF